MKGLGRCPYITDGHKSIGGSGHLTGAWYRELEKLLSSLQSLRGLVLPGFPSWSTAWQAPAHASAAALHCVTMATARAKSLLQGTQLTSEVILRVFVTGALSNSNVMVMTSHHCGSETFW